MKKFIKKYCYATMPIIVLPILVCIIYMFEYNKTIDDMTPEFLGTVIGMAGTLIGFLFTAMTVFLSLPKENEVMKRVKTSRHHIIFGKCVMCGVTFLALCILSWLFDMLSIITVIFFLAGMIETLICVYYIYTLCVYNF